MMSRWTPTISSTWLARYKARPNYHLKGTGANKAQWTFSGLPAGQYEVVAIWSATNHNATNAQYTVNGSAAPLMNQRVAPDDVWFSSTPPGVSYSTLWEILGIYATDSTGKITVVLSDKANGQVIADAIRVVMYEPAGQLAAGRRLMASFGMGAETQPLTLDQVQDVLPEAIASWSHSTSRELPNGIPVRVEDLPAGVLGEIDGNQIVLDINANGAGWFVDRDLRDESALGGVASASSRVDLLTVLAHEVGHLLGFDHSSDPYDVMAASLAVGTRRVPGYSPLATESRSILDSLGGSAHRKSDKPLKAQSEPLILPLRAGPVDHAQSSSRPADARLLHEATDEAIQLIDDELLDNNGLLDLLIATSAQRLS